jgi:hypothetical protein
MHPKTPEHIYMGFRKIPELSIIWNFAGVTFWHPGAYAFGF